MSTSERILFAGSYATAEQPSIYQLSLDIVTGELIEQGSIAGIASPAFVLLHPNKRWLYATGETSEQDGMPGAVWSLNISQEAPHLALINNQPSRGDFPCHLAIDGSGRWIVVSNYGTGNVGVLPIMPDGSLGDMSDFVQHHGSGPNRERQPGPHAHSAIFSPDNCFLIVADLGIDALVIYKFDAQTGRIEAHEQVKTRPGAGPRHMAWHPEKAYLYVANELESSVASYDFDPTEGRLLQREVVSTLPAEAPENTVADIHVSPAGDRVYVSNRGHDSIAIFGIEADGSLARLAISSCGGNWPRAFALAPGGRFVVVANEHSGGLSVLPIQSQPDALGAAVSVADIPQVSTVQFML